MIGQLIGWFGKGAMIGMVDMADKNGIVSVRDGIEQGKKYGIKLFQTYFVINIPVFVMVGIGGLILYSSILAFIVELGPEVFGKTYQLTGEVPAEVEKFIPGFLGSIVCGVPLLCGGLLISFVINIMNEFAARVIIFEGLDIRPAISRSWKIFKRNLGYIFLTLITFAIISFFLNLFLASSMLKLWIPVAKSILRGFWTTSSITSGFYFVILFLIVNIGFGSLVTAFISVLWTRLYQECTLKDSLSFSNQLEGIEVPLVE